MIIPDKSILDIYEKMIKPINNIKSNLSGQIRVLSQTHDSLLLKLLTGEIIIDEKQTSSEAVA